MTDTDNPFGTFTPQPGPTFAETDDGKGNKLTPPAEVSPTRKSRRSKRLEKSHAPALSAIAKRRYTRRKPAQDLAASIDKVAAAGASTGQQALSELDLVTEIVTKLRQLDAKARIRVTQAIGRLL